MPQGCAKHFWRHIRVLYWRSLETHVCKWRLFKVMWKVVRGICQRHLKVISVVVGESLMVVIISFNLCLQI